MINVQGTVLDIIFRNDENLYSIFILETSDGEITVVGTVLDLNIGDTMSISGKLIYHNTYGEQLQIKDYEKIMPNSVSQIERYLSSGIISNIREKRARELVKEFGEDTLRIMLEEPEKLLKIKGIGKKTLEKIHEDIKKANESREVIIYLQKFNLGNKLTNDIYVKYKSSAKNIIENNPYQLVDDIRGIGFNTADKIALQLGIRPDSEFRIRSAVSYILLESANKDGNCFLEYENFIKSVTELLGLKRENVENEIPNLILFNRIKILEIDNKTIVYLREIYDLENSVSQKLIYLMNGKNRFIDIDIEKEISFIEKLDNIKYSETQKKAITTAMREKLMIITGGPGTGKTTIIKAIMQMVKNLKYKYVLCAPTGRAAKKMEESTSNEAFTIHRMLGYKSVDSDHLLEYNEENPLDYDVIIVDELSMVDIYLMNNLLNAIRNDAIIIFVGDSDQLPSVGPGNVLNDMIKSSLIPTIKLDIIFRQDEESNIVKNAHLINNGQSPILNEENKDFFFIKTKNDHHTLNTIINLVIDRLPNYYKVDPLNDIQVLTPTRRGICGVENLNKELQSKLNEEAFNKIEYKYGDTIFREKDKIMQIKNNYDIDLKDEYLNTIKGLYNGDIGYIRNIFLENKTFEIDFDKKIATYTTKELPEIVLAYATTIHKSQGSEFPVVIIPLASAPPMLLTRNILYTGITRAKSLVVLVGREEIMNKMINNTYRQERNSTLDYFIRLNNAKFEEFYD